MDELRRSRKLGRLLAAWLLLWFVAMGAMPIPPMASLGTDAWATPPVETHSGHDAHSGDDPIDQDPHAGHASGSLSHCPVCMHAAASPPAQAGPSSTASTPGDRPSAHHRTHVARRTDVPPPARGPPVLS